MVSNIIPAYPVAGSPTTQSVRNNFQAAHDEISALQTLAPSTTTPTMNGTAAPGSSAAWSRGDHVHPTDTSRAPINSPTFTGTPTAPIWVVNGAAGTFRTVYGQTAGSNRWDIVLGDNTAESGSSAGSAFAINSFQDNGSSFNQLMVMTRIGQTTFPSAYGVTATSYQINGPAGSWRVITGQTSGSGRWGIQLGDGTPESGGNAGSNFNIYAYTDAGTNVQYPAINITRSNNEIVFGSGVSAQTGWHTKAGSTGAATGNTFNIQWTGSSMDLWLDSGHWGVISVTSDYRTKRNVSALGSMWERVKLLTPISYQHCDWTMPSGTEFKGDDVERWGFVAHELQATLVESAASGVKDDPDTVQAPNVWPVVAALTKALQEAMARIETLETIGTISGENQ